MTLASKLRKFIPLILILLCAVLLLAFAPNEKTLGNGIKPVYIHVSLTWSGMVGFILAAVLGLVGLIKTNQRLVSWMKTIFLASLTVYLAGFLMSMWASYVNWGGIPFREPRYLSTFNVIAVAAITGAFFLSLSNPRLVALAGMFPSFFLFFTGDNSRMVLHPENPARTAPDAIRNTFLGMFVLALMLSIWLAFYYRRWAEVRKS